MLKAVVANTTRLDPESNATLIDCYDGGDDEEDREPAGELPMMCDLHSIAHPFPPDDDGKAELLKANVAGRDGAIVGGWDTRLAEMAGELGPGDACDFAPHPNKAVRVLYKGGGRAWSVIVDGKDGSQAIITLAGKEGFQVNVHGHAMKIDKDGFAMCSANGQHGIEVTNSGVSFRGSITAGLPGLPGLTLAVATQAQWGVIGATPVFSLKTGG